MPGVPGAPGDPGVPGDPGEPGTPPGLGGLCGHAAVVDNKVTESTVIANLVFISNLLRFRAKKSHA
jgi:hypothetical protein